MSQPNDFRYHRIQNNYGMEHIQQSRRHYSCGNKQPKTLSYNSSPLFPWRSIQSLHPLLDGLHLAIIRRIQKLEIVLKLRRNILHQTLLLDPLLLLTPPLRSNSQIAAVRRSLRRNIRQVRRCERLDVRLARLHDLWLHRRCSAGNCQWRRQHRFRVHRRRLLRRQRRRRNGVVERHRRLTLSAMKLLSHSHLIWTVSSCRSAAWPSRTSVSFAP